MSLKLILVIILCINKNLLFSINNKLPSFSSLHYINRCNHSQDSNYKSTINQLKNLTDEESQVVEDVIKKDNNLSDEQKKLIHNGLVKELIIFVHGTVKFYPINQLFDIGSSSNTLKKLFYDYDKNNKVPAKAGGATREDLFKKEVGLQGLSLGLFEIDSPESVKKNSINKETYHSIVLPLQKKMSLRSKRYIFNWPGGLVDGIRWISAKILFEEIRNLKEKYPNAKIITFGHSHGGSILIEIANIAKKEKYNHILIDDLFTIGTPLSPKVQKWTTIKNNNNEYYFTNVYALYSKNDTVFDPGIDFPKPTMREFYPVRKNIYNINFNYFNNSVYDSFNHHDLWFIENLPDFQKNIFVKLIIKLYEMVKENSFKNPNNLLTYNFSLNDFQITPETIIYNYNNAEYFNEGLMAKLKNIVYGPCRVIRAFWNLWVYKKIAL